jgi:fructan beta-fructosidase
VNPEHFRPKYHFTPPQNWMNDPNGLVYHEGEYHLFYQHNPYGTQWGHMSWGHAVSADLVTWSHLPIALYENSDQGYTIFSGSAVMDDDNTSGFGAGGDPPMVAVYTADYRAEPGLETIHIAYSTDRGRTFTEYRDNPVIDENERKFGDPKVFWHAPSRRWVMVNIYGHEQGYVILYNSADLKRWTRLSEFHVPADAPGIWECPDLFPLPLDGDPTRIHWVLKVNCTRAPGESAATRYFVGDFDGERFIDAKLVGRSMTSDDGAIYAEVTYNQLPDERRILVGWLREQPHPERPWTGAQSLPRELALISGPEGPELVQRPVSAVQALRGSHHGFSVSHLEGLYPLSEVDLGSRALEVVAELPARGAADASAQRYGLRLTLSSGDVVEIGLDAERDELYLLGGGAVEQSGSAIARLRRIATPFALFPDAETITLRVFLDQAVVEAFAGEHVAATRAGITAFIPFGAQVASLALFAEGGSAAALKVDVWNLMEPGR